MQQRLETDDFNCDEDDQAGYEKPDVTPPSLC